MDYLHELQYYIDRYDLSTIKRCLVILDVEKKMLKHKSLKKWHTVEVQKHEVSKVVAFILNPILADEYSEKEKTITKWITDDTEIQNHYDLAQTPNIKCEQCPQLMTEMHRTFKGSDYKTSPLEFVLICEKCRIIKHVDEEGTAIIREPDYCEKCHAVVHYDYKDIEKDVWEHTYTCVKCGNKFYEKVDHRDLYKKMEDDRKRDQQLLQQYRERFCLEGETAEKLVKAVGNLRLAADVFKYEYSKHATPAKTRVHNAKKLDINGLEKLLNYDLLPKGYSNLRIGQPAIDRYVDIPFTLHITSSEEKGDATVHTLASTLKQILENTNWRLMKDKTYYRLGYLSGIFRGYEREDDLEKLFEEKIPKPETVKPPDPELMEKFDGYAGWAGLAKMTAAYQAKEDRRQENLKKSPDGYCLDESDDSTHQCTVCWDSMKITERWYCKYGILCNNCHRNLTSNGIDHESISEREYFDIDDIKRIFKLRKLAEINKFIEENKLVFHELVDQEGNVYLKLFLKEENWKFVKNNPIGHALPPMIMDDGKGGTFKL